jgi:hypothetical protein
LASNLPVPPVEAIVTSDFVTEMAMTPEAIAAAVVLPLLEPPIWTHAEAIAFEAARECIGEVMAICSAELHREEGRPAPNAERVRSLRAELASLGAERASLRVHDADQVATVRAVYGARVRDHRSQQQSQVASQS